jgi:hypothetical protein
LSRETGQNRDHSIAILGGVYAILIIFAFYGSFKFTVWGTDESLKNFAAVVTVCLTAASAIMGIIASFVSLHKNLEAAAQLETLKSQLQVDVLSKKIAIDLRFEYEKTKTTTEQSAYSKLWTSTDYAYLLLAKLETRSWKSDDKLLMDNALLEAHAQLVYARSPEHQTLWEKVRQRARFMSEEAAKIEVVGQSALWATNVADFANLCRQLKEIAKTEINRPPPVQEVLPK